MPLPDEEDLTPAETPAAKAPDFDKQRDTDDNRAVVALERIAGAYEEMAASQKILAAAAIDIVSRFDDFVAAVEEIPRRMAEQNEHDRSGVGG